MRTIFEFLAATTALLIALAVGQLIWQFVAGFFGVRRALTDHPMVANPKAVVTLIHGTFARKAPWTRPGSRLCGQVEAYFGGQVQLRRFGWSGRNSFRARSRAVIALNDDLAAVGRQHPQVPHYLIGHSHGGNVALGGAMHGEVDGVICLATPVLTTRRRRFPPLTRIMIGFGFFMTLLLPLIDLENSGEASDFEAGAALVCAALAVVWYRAARVIAARICEDRPYHKLDPERVAFIRSPFDEASGIIGLANVVGWAISRLTAGPFELLQRFAREASVERRTLVALGFAGVTIVGAIAISLPDLVEGGERILADDTWLGAIHLVLSTLIVLIGLTGFVLNILAPVLRRARSNKLLLFLLWPLFLYAGIFGGLFFLPAILLMSLTHAAAVGGELLICSVLVEVTAEPCPAGNWTVFQLRPPAETSLRHSSVYESDSGLAAVLAALEAIIGNGPAPLLSDQVVPGAIVTASPRVGTEVYPQG